MLPIGRAYSHLFVGLTICQSHFCLEHISKSIEGNLMKLDTLIEGTRRISEYKNHNPITSIYGVTSLFNFALKSLSGAYMYLWKYARELNET